VDKVYRARIDQPSTLQLHHALHNKRGIVVDKYPNRPIVLIYFTEGSLLSMEIGRECVTKVRGA
jgi:hypothetical protein